MVKFYLVFVLLFVSCETIKYQKLEDGISRVPSDEFFFDKNYKSKFRIVLPKGIDTNSIYIESFYLDTRGKLFSSNKGLNSFINGIKFYANGCVSCFVIDKDSLSNLSKLNPLNKGYRGISYLKHKDTIIEIIGPIDESYNLGKKRYYLKINKDTLFLEDKKTSSKFIYLRHKLEGDINYKADW